MAAGLVLDELANPSRLSALTRAAIRLLLPRPWLQNRAFHSMKPSFFRRAPGGGRQNCTLPVTSGHYLQETLLVRLKKPSEH
jgi:hypothetical protein